MHQFITCLLDLEASKVKVTFFVLCLKHNALKVFLINVTFSDHSK